MKRVVSAITGVGVVLVEELNAPPIAELLRGDRLRSTNDETKVLLAASRLALRDARLTGGGMDPDDDLGVVVATQHAGHEDYIALYLSGIDRDHPHVNPARGPRTGLNAPAAQMSIRLHAAGPNATLSNGPVGGLDALRYAADAIQAEQATTMLVCGVDIMTAAESPDEPTRQSGGAAVVVLEAGGSARARSAPVRAIVAGVATAYSPQDDLADASARALRGALCTTNLPADAIESNFDCTIGETAGMASVAQLVRAASSLCREEATGPVVVAISDEACSAGAAILVSCDRQVT
jgi:3-oxoacyl-(acyl-carrier-protein) synthase